jgi:poly(A) polymerase
MPGREHDPSTGPLLDVDPLAVELGERFTAAGFRLYLVGGSVRNLVLGKPSPADDLDFATDARPEDTVRVLQGWADYRYLQGMRFGTVGARKDQRARTSAASRSRRSGKRSIPTTSASRR